MKPNQFPQSKTYPKALALVALLGLVLSSPAANAGLIGYYTFENNVLDVSGNGNHGTTSTVAPTYTASGYQGGAYQFGTGGADTFVRAPIDINPAALPQVTFGAWVNADVADAVIRGIISHDDGGFDRTIDVDTRNDGNARWCYFVGGTGTCDGLVVAGKWTFLAARYDASSGLVALTVDDFHAGGTGLYPGSSVETSTLIGRNPNFDFPFMGRIDNVFFYDEYLTNAQLDDIRQNGISVPEPGSLALLGISLAALVAMRRRKPA